MLYLFISLISFTVINTCNNDLKVVKNAETCRRS
jgi:hypothetical protein